MAWLGNSFVQAREVAEVDSPTAEAMGHPADSSAAETIAYHGDDVLSGYVGFFEAAMRTYDKAQQLLASNPERARSLFREAAQQLSLLTAAGITNGRLEYNLGNCYLQAGDVGRAILNYRRAQRLRPRDPYIADNLAQARSRRLTDIQPSRRSALLRSVFFWHFQTSLTGRIKTAIGLYTACWVVLMIRSFVRRRAVTTVAGVCALLCGAVAASAAVSQWSDRNAPEGVILSTDVAVHKGPGPGYPRQFEQPLQPGVEFTVRQRTRTGWWRIELPDGNTGWIEAAHAELIPKTWRSTFRFGSAAHSRADVQ